jgi:hypothetical protein
MVTETRHTVWGIKEGWNKPRRIARNVAYSLAIILVHSAVNYWEYKNAWMN